MPYRDKQGHFISGEEARRRGLPPSEAEPIKEPEEEAEEEGTEVYPPPQGWSEQADHPTKSVFIDTGRGQTVEARVGLPFQLVLERIAEEAHYGGYFRVFLNGEEIVNPEEAPTAIEAGMRIAVTSYRNRGCVPANSGKAEMLILSQVGA